MCQWSQLKATYLLTTYLLPQRRVEPAVTLHLRRWYWSGSRTNNLKAISSTAGQIACILLFRVPDYWLLIQQPQKYSLQYLNGCIVQDICMINGENTNNFFHPALGPITQSLHRVARCPVFTYTIRLWVIWNKWTINTVPWQIISSAYKIVCFHW